MQIPKLCKLRARNINESLWGWSVRGTMNFIIKDDYQQLSKDAAKVVIDIVTAKPNATICLPTGSTPIGMYQQLVDAYNNQEVDFSQVNIRSVDEYVGLSASHNQSYAYFLNEYFLKHVNVNPKNVILINGAAKDLEKECYKYQDLVNSTGIDLYIDGIGENGHIGFNEPSTVFELDYHLQSISENTREINARFFDNAQEVPTKCVTVGVNSIVQSKVILILSSGLKKAAIWKKILTTTTVDPQLPASILQLCKNAIIIMDKDSGSMVEKQLQIVK